MSCKTPTRRGGVCKLPLPCRGSPRREGWPSRRSRRRSHASLRAADRSGLGDNLPKRGERRGGFLPIRPSRGIFVFSYPYFFLKTGFDCFGFSLSNSRPVSSEFYPGGARMGLGYRLLSTLSTISKLSKLSKIIELSTFIDPLLKVGQKCNKNRKIRG